MPVSTDFGSIVYQSGNYVEYLLSSSQGIRFIVCTSSVSDVIYLYRIEYPDARYRDIVNNVARYSFSEALQAYHELMHRVK